LEIYDSLFRDRNKNTLVEIGFFDGASTLYFAQRFDFKKIYAFDIRGEVKSMVEAIDRLQLQDRCSVHFGFSQDDEAGLLNIKDIHDGNIDVVIDDASHNYALTKKTFEVLFPRLARDGLYIIEDWAWAHADATQMGGSMFEHYKKETALTRLSVEIQILMASHRAYIEEVRVFTDMIVIKKAAKCPPLEGFSIESAIKNRGRSIDIG
jgi:predicted O-methyltransferase YrrM